MDITLYEEKGIEEGFYLEVDEAKLCDIGGRGRRSLFLGRGAGFERLSDTLITTLRCAVQLYFYTPFSSTF
jgi:hypothetical protein